MTKNWEKKKRIKNNEFEVGCRTYGGRKFIHLSLLPQITFTRLGYYYGIDIRFLNFCLYAGWVDHDRYEYLISKNK
jgi:hypothetical protein